ncbi:MAG: hypothetical protein WCH11_01685, partial [Bdellovibrio sp.]
SQIGGILKDCKAKSILTEASCQKESEQNIKSIEIHQGYDKPERGTPDRSFEFELGPNSQKFEEDSHLLVMDAPDEKPSHSQFSLMMFFPRIQKTKIQVADDKSILAVLTNGEKISFSPEKHIPSEGVLVQTRSVEPNKLISPSLKYTGLGFMLRADWRADGFIGKKKVRLQGRGKECDLTPHGSLIWNENMEFKFETDDQWDKFVRKNCGFSVL